MSGTQVDFYVMGAADPRARLTTACRLAEKAYEQGLRVAVRTASPSETAEIDELMWAFSDRSFVPHAVWPAEPAVAEATPVLIASGALPDDRLYRGSDGAASAADPVHIVRRFARGDDREIAGFCAAGLAFGRVTGLMATIERLLVLHGAEPGRLRARLRPGA